MARCEAVRTDRSSGASEAGTWRCRRTRSRRRLLSAPMRRRAPTAALPALASVLALGVLAGLLGASSELHTLPRRARSSRARPARPARPLGRGAGHDLAERRAQARRREPGRDAVLALAGGPGQAALPLAEFIAEAIAPALTTRDLIVFDQRGTGASDPLELPRVRRPAAWKAPPRHVGRSSNSARCRSDPPAAPTRAGIGRRHRGAPPGAYGYEKLVLYGTSYGTKVALEYAERYPQNVEALVLDSVVPLDGPEPFAHPDLPGDPAGARTSCAPRRVRGHHPQPGGRPRHVDRAASRPAAAAARCTTAPATATRDARRARAVENSSRAISSGAARAAAGGRALGAAPRPGSAAAPAPARRRASSRPLPADGDPEAEPKRTRGRRQSAVRATSCEEAVPLAAHGAGADPARGSARRPPARSPAGDFYPFDATTASPTAGHRLRAAGPTPRRRLRRPGRCLTCRR